MMHHTSGSGKHIRFTFVFPITPYTHRERDYYHLGEKIQTNTEITVAYITTRVFMEKLFCCFYHLLTKNAKQNLVKKYIYMYVPTSMYVTIRFLFPWVGRANLVGCA